MMLRFMAVALFAPQTATSLPKPCAIQRRLSSRILMQRHKRNGVGLANTRERLQELYGVNQSFALSTTDPHGLTINIRIPLEISEQAVAA